MNGLSWRSFSLCYLLHHTIPCHGSSSSLVSSSNMPRSSSYSPRSLTFMRSTSLRLAARRGRRGGGHDALILGGYAFFLREAGERGNLRTAKDEYASTEPQLPLMLTKLSGKFVFKRFVFNPHPFFSLVILLSPAAPLPPLSSSSSRPVRSLKKLINHLFPVR